MHAYGHTQEMPEEGTMAGLARRDSSRALGTGSGGQTSGAATDEFQDLWPLQLLDLKDEDMVSINI